MSRKFKKSPFIGLLLGSLSTDLIQAAPTDPATTVNEDAAKWASVVAQHPRYVIAKGDTLSTIAKKVFGSTHFWKKIWASNKDVITNPNQLKKGVTLTFSAEMPSAAALQVLSTPPATDPDSSTPSKKRSKEWQLLPKQSWERYATGFPEGIDSLGFDRRDRIANHPPVGFELQAIPLAERATILGEIFGSRSESAYFSMNEIVYVKADETVKVGNTYAVTQAPTVLKSRDPDRSAFSYLIMGKIKILGVHAHVFIGRIVSSRYFIPRGALLMALPPRIPEMTPTAGTTTVRGELVMDHNFSTGVTAQFKEVFVDRGSADGVKVGNVFRAYRHYDPGTQGLLSHSDFIIDADLLVTRVTDNFCSAVVLRSTSPISEGTTVSLVKDLSWLKNYEFEQYTETNNTPENLDNLDDQDGLRPNEAKELQQLEAWKDNPDAPPGGPIPAPLPERLPESAAGEGALGEPPLLPEALPLTEGDASAGLAAPAPLPEVLPEALPENLNAPVADGAAPPPLPDSLPPLPEGGVLPPPPSVAGDAPLPDVLPPLPDPVANAEGGLPPPPPEGSALSDAAGLPPPLPEANAALSGTAGLPPPLPDTGSAGAPLAPPPPDLSGTALAPPPPDTSGTLPPPPSITAVTAVPAPPPAPSVAAMPPALTPTSPPANGGLLPPLDAGLDSMPVAQEMPPPLPE